MSYVKIKKKNNRSLYGSVSINGSKSISNRLLILKAIYKDEIDIVNLSNCEDTEILKSSLTSYSNILDIHHAGTAMRFLTSYLSIQKEREVILTGSKRMKERPILVLVDALRKLGAEINFLEKEGYPPIKILGKEITGGEININAQVSSQYISSLMLVASKFKNGLKIFMQDNVTSFPYIKMTFDLLILSGIKVLWNNKKVIHIFPGKKKQKKCFYIESDWSSASYYYSMSAIAKESKIILSSYDNNSLQGDKEVSYIYEKYFGISTLFKENKIIIFKKINFSLPKFFELNLNKTPDIAQTITVTSAALGIKCFLKGLETLKIKETDRLIALKKELHKIGVKTNITNYSIEITDFLQEKNHCIFFNTYQDHRMAMSFAPLGLQYSICIEDPNVVKKSYPNFWIDLKSIGFSIENDYFSR
ncbi:3-phosphoshikimate 1-carboxyvinyltransferase [Blattabacterium cuenoti]|uniref:3-phosphoshikimate 1-carboxyvinyltransferase n=1 Tax=Blattabacterium cuenoti TaxID=1653831 RepID=UPI00163C973D|nr:3-phosphoshikimate 1-carboxyvinyltransferase [Blattabacterium cuenoti]